MSSSRWSSIDKNKKRSIIKNSIARIPDGIRRGGEVEMELGLGLFAQRDALHWNREATKLAPETTAAQFQLAAAGSLGARGR